MSASRIQMKTEQKPEPRNKSQSAPVPGVARANSRKDGDSTRERMLDAAEALFAEQGYHGTSLREVAQALEVRIALVTYHFGTKDLLFDKVVERRASYMAHQRILALDNARGRAGNAPIPIEELVAGYVWPFVERSSAGGKNWRNYSMLVSRHANSPEWAKVISVHYDAVARQYLTEFERSLPSVPREDVFHAFSAMVGVMVAIVAESGRVENLSFGKVQSSNVEHVYSRALPFLVGGFKALMATRS